MKTFTLNNTLNEIMNAPKISGKLEIFSAALLLSFLTEEQKDWTLERLKKEVLMPWGMPFPAEEILHGANEALALVTDRKYTFYPLWEKESFDYYPDIQANDRTTVCLMTTNILTLREKPAAIIVPGGGYEMTSLDNEGVQIAEALEALGYGTFILQYRVKPNSYPAPQLDLALAFRFIRKNAERFHVDPDNILLIGFSAGGHLSASYTAFHEEYGRLLMEELQETNPDLASGYAGISGKPDKLCLGYPVISFRQDIDHEDSFQALTGGDETLREKLSVERHVTKDWPQTFVWTCLTDELVPAENTLVLDQALEKAHVKHKTILFDEGPHGLGLGIGSMAEGWLQQMVDFMEPRLQKEGVPFEYFAKCVAPDTWLIGCDEAAFGPRSGKTIAFGMPTGNSWMIVGDEYALLIDSCGTIPGLRAFAETIAGKPVKLFLSHAHPDHIYQISEFDELYLHKDDFSLLYGKDNMGTFTLPEQIPEAVHDISEITELKLSENHILDLKHFPGHTDGSMIFFDRNTRLLFSGDSVGRHLLYGTHSYYSYRKYMENLQSLKQYYPIGYCSAHERRILDPGMPDFMCEVLKDFPKADRFVQYTPEMDPLYAMTRGNEHDMFFLDCSYPVRLKDKILKTAAENY